MNTRKVAGRRLMAAWRTDLDGTTRQLDILYENNEQVRVLERQAGFVKQFLGQACRYRADAITDHRIVANYPDGEYASSNHEDCSIWRWVCTSAFY
ncbi:MAG TPA: hypothetical protein VKF63_11930 [Terracidiphilus sp.]|nr:hypothetical protein [Terracidiphilus sp.]